MIHPHTELRFINPLMGFGVFATAFIPKGTITWVRDDLDQVIARPRVTKLLPRYRDLLEKYTFRDTAGRHILCWDIARFVNHSCEPTCLGLDSDFEIAIRDIQPGQELTDDYATLNLLAHEAFQCGCGTPSCRHYVGPGDYEILQSHWESLYAEAEPLIERVDQPLRPLLLKRRVAV